MTVEPPRRLSALALLVPLDESPLGTAWVCEVEGAIVASGPLAHGLQWVGGVPRAAKQALLTVVLPGTVAAGRVRLLFQEAGPNFGVGEVFLYGPDEAPVAPAGEAAAGVAYDRARAGDWDEAVRRYAEAVRLEPERASYHAALARAERRARGRRRLDVESLDDGGPAVVGRR